MTLNTVYKVGYTAVVVVAAVGTTGFVSGELVDAKYRHVKEDGENEVLATFEEYAAGFLAGSAIGAFAGKLIANTWGL